MKELHPGQVAVVLGGKYDGQGAQIKKVLEDRVECLIAGKIVTLKRERFETQQEVKQ